MQPTYAVVLNFGKLVNNEYLNFVCCTTHQSCEEVRIVTVISRGWGNLLERTNILISNCFSFRFSGSNSKSKS